ncbi:type VI secretion system membrane subunit TssM [Pseudomonas sp. xss_4]|uniref:type VI secretion system membrane subunit TssM n=1 Tax=Pseudomonas TaxID=286 RepID=UPI0018AB498D|nr:type VI secretion system membrane subunit TssM [Pseudomonas putida]MBF8767753.1 type VI secretion system membrane subunit TssM [Pseudomonas putida]
MSRIWTYLKRFGLPLVRQFNSAMPVLLLLACCFLMIGIWWLGPQLTWRDQQPLAELSMRVLATVLLVLVPTLIWALVLRSRNQRFEEAQRQAQRREEDPSLRFVEAQDRALDLSLAALRQNLGGRDALYRLPWYLVLGEENAGKTSLINRSNQSFSLTAITKAGSRRQHGDPDLAYPVDWWIGDQAVLIDPPGEIISQSDVPPLEGAPPQAAEGEDGDASSSVDGGESRLPLGTHARLWDGLVSWLGRNRSRRPLNGVVLVVDIVALLGRGASDRKALAILLRSRLAELSSQLGTRPPLYVTLTKFDQLEGFGPFFARLPRSVREDIFGFTFTLESMDDFDAWLSELSTSYDAFVSRLNEQVFDALGEPTSQEQREGLFSLVRQLAGMRPVLLGFLREILGSDRFTTPALVRGVYFSSVYQQGLVCNAFVNAAARSYGMPEPVPGAQPDGRSVVYFAQRLFQQIIYPEAGLAGDNVKVLADKKRVLIAGCCAATLGGVLVAAGWHHYYVVNRDKAASVLEKSREFSAARIDGRIDPTGRNLLEPLDQIRSAVAVYGDYREAWPLVSDMGLYHGRTIGPKVDEAYLQLLSRRYLPALATGAMNAIEAAGDNSTDQLAALRVYRMIEDRENRRPEIVEEWMARQWQTAFPAEGRVQGALMRHLEYAMKYADASLPQYRQRVREVQQQLRQIPLQQRVYMAMKQQAQDALYAPLDLRHEVGPAFDTLFKPVAQQDGHVGTRIDALLTGKGFRGYFEPHSHDLTELAMIDQWTLGERARIDYSEADKQALAQRIRALYNADYIDTWHRSLGQLDVVDFDNISQAVEVLGSVTSPAAPLRRLVETVRDNSTIYPMATATSEGAQAQIPSSEAVSREQAAVISRAFATMSGLLTPKGETPPFLDGTMLAIGDVYDTVRAVQDSPDRGKAALESVLSRFTLKGPDSIGNLQRVAAGLPEPLNRHVKKLADESSHILLIEALRELERRWDADVYGFYSQRLAGRYPFNPASRVDASLEDFEAFFGPQGRLQKFREQYLKLFLEDNLDALYSERRGGYLVRTDVLAQLEAANRIRDAFFNNRGALGVQFAVEPLGLTPNRRSSVLGIEGQLVPYSHGPSSTVGLIWPNSLGDGTESRITLINSTGNSSSLTYRGPWSLFRLLGQARVNGATDNSVDLSFTANDGGMRYRITAEKANNPFTQRPFNGFVLPRTLLQDSAGVRVASVGQDRSG